MTKEEMKKAPREELLKIIQEAPALDIGIFVGGGEDNGEKDGNKKSSNNGATRNSTVD